VISTVLAEYPWVFRLLLTVAVLACVIVGVVLLRPSAWARRTLGTLAALSLLLVLALTLSPESGGESNGFCGVDGLSAGDLGITGLANIVLFVPFTLWGGLATRRPLAAFAVAVGLSACIEAAQGVFGGLGRSCTTSDWMLNAAGAALGALLCAAILFAVRRRAARSVTAPS
jgi:hypothetical protein